MINKALLFSETQFWTISSIMIKIRCSNQLQLPSQNFKVMVKLNDTSMSKNFTRRGKILVDCRIHRPRMRAFVGRLWVLREVTSVFKLCMITSIELCMFIYTSFCDLYPFLRSRESWKYTQRLYFFILHASWLNFCLLL